MTRSTVERYRAAENDVRSLAASAHKALAQLSTTPLVLDAAMAVILKHGLLSDLSDEIAGRQAAKTTVGESAP